MKELIVSGIFSFEIIYSFEILEEFRKLKK